MKPSAAAERPEQTTIRDVLPANFYVEGDTPLLRPLDEKGLLRLTRQARRRLGL